jgi:iron complex outermembrane receptor protein
LDTKFVSRQYIDNTQNVSRSLDPYLVNDLRLILSYQTVSGSVFSWDFTVNNVFNEQYESNAWVYRYFLGGVESTVFGYYPQAGRHFVTGIKCRF